MSGLIALRHLQFQSAANSLAASARAIFCVVSVATKSFGASGDTTGKGNTAAKEFCP